MPPPLDWFKVLEDTLLLKIVVFVMLLLVLVPPKYKAAPEVVDVLLTKVLLLKTNCLLLVVMATAPPVAPEFPSKRAPETVMFPIPLAKIAPPSPELVLFLKTQLVIVKSESVVKLITAPPELVSAFCNVIPSKETVRPPAVISNIIAVSVAVTIAPDCPLNDNDVEIPTVPVWLSAPTMIIVVLSLSAAAVTAWFIVVKAVASVNPSDPSPFADT